MFKCCRLLIDRVKGKVIDWKNRSLSYAGRIQLIASILSAMQIYWASVYMLPKAVIKDIDKILRGFLWNQNISSNGKSKLSWKAVCRPKNQGGLGFKPLGEWNEVLLMKHVWNIIVKRNSVWGQWVNNAKLKDRNFWDVNVEKGDSWGWKIMVELRDKIKPYVKMEIGDGKSTSIWFDPWYNNEPLSKYITRRAIYDARLHGNETVADMIKADMIKEGEWNWPEEWCEKFPVLNNIQVPMQQTRFNSLDGYE